jgi:CHAT domain-containing protein
MKKSFYNKILIFRVIVHYSFMYLIFSMLPVLLSGASGNDFSTCPGTQSGKGAGKIISMQNSGYLKRNILRFQILSSKGDLASAGSLVDSIKTFLNSGSGADSVDLANASYFLGSYYLKYGNYTDAIIYSKKAADFFEKTGRTSFINYSNCLYNSGLAYLYLGDFNKSIYFFQSTIENDRIHFGDDSFKLVEGYLVISITYINMREYEKAIESINNGLRITQLFPDSVNPLTRSKLYSTKGVAYSLSANYIQAKSNLEKAEFYIKDLNNEVINYINVLDNLGTVNHFLGLKEKSFYYYEKGLKLGLSDFSNDMFNLVNNYAIILGNDHQEKKGQLLLSDFLKRTLKTSDSDHRNYYNVLQKYADYLREYEINNNLAIQLFQQSYNYINSHPWDKNYRDNTIMGYSLALHKRGDNMLALDSIQTLLFPEKADNNRRNIFLNPYPDSVKPDGRTVKILNSKYRILWSEYLKTSDIKILKAAAETSELIIAILEKIRLNIGEEGSRLLLGDKYRYSYMDAILCLSECYSKTGNESYLKKTFEYSERSKVASLLASTREMKAIQNHIPSALANKEIELLRNIGFYNAEITGEENSENPDRGKINLWNDYVLAASQQRDSIVAVFEKNYPDYYSLKYNTKVISLKEIPEIIGRGKNYLSYIVSDSILYTLVSNSKYSQLISQKIDSSFFNAVTEFRKILTAPDLDEKSADEFYRFQKQGYNLYSYLIAPVKKYLISGTLVISPDDILSYLPFETFVSDNRFRNDLLYRKLPYLMNDFRISYAYSVTLLAEYEKAKSTLRNSAVIFAPSYNLPVNIDSISNERQSSDGILRPLPYALNEAEYVSEITHGSLFTDTTATKSAYKLNAGDFDIIHLSMHTLINNQNPIFSKMIFSISKDTLDNIGLNVFEVYGIPLKAKMVFLSSCNTGYGNLLRGEGILSLARGFIYSGSKSVVMSLWEVDDRSGSDIVKSFYRHLKNGNSKSEALRKARMKYLKNAVQVKANPYFWSALVIYGDDAPLYHSFPKKLIAVLIPLILITGVVIYFKKR